MKEETERQVIEALRGFWSAYESGSPDFFDHLTEDVDLFLVTGTSRIDGVKRYRERFEADLQGTMRAVQVFDLQVRSCADDWAWVTYHSRIRLEAMSNRCRVTLLFVKTEEGRFKIAHLHISPWVQEPSPVVAQSDEGIEEITDFADLA